MTGDEPVKPGSSLNIRRLGKQFLLLLLFVGWVALFVLVLPYPADKQGVVVTQHNWHREVVVEQYNEVSHSSWKDEVPQQATLTRCDSKQRSTKSVEEKQCAPDAANDCKTVIRKQAVEDDWCAYTLRQWVSKRTETNSGTGSEARWPYTILRSCRSDDTLGCERKGQKTARYELSLKDPDGGIHSCKLKEEIWKQVADGQSLMLKFRVHDGGPICDEEVILKQLTTADSKEGK